MSALSIISLLFLVATLMCIAIQFVKNDDTWTFISLLLVATTIVLFYALGGAEGYKNGEKEGQIEALKGNFNYEMKILYEEKDGGFIPVDTLFIIK